MTKADTTGVTRAAQMFSSWRTDQGLSLRDVAGQAGVSQSVLRGIEAGETPSGQDWFLIEKWLFTPPATKVASKRKG